MSERILKSCCFVNFIKKTKELHVIAERCREIIQWADNSVTETQRFCSDLPRFVRVFYLFIFFYLLSLLVNF